MDNAKTKRKRITHAAVRGYSSKPVGTEIEDLHPVNPELQPGQDTVYRVHKLAYHITNYLYAALMTLLDILKHDKDAVIIIDGKERSGKSVLAQQIAYFLDATFTIDRICFTPQEFIQAIKDTPRGGAIILDEALTTLFSRQAMTKNNVFMVKTIAEVGQKNLVLLVVLPTFFDLDKYVSIWRAVGLFHVKEREGTRGYYDFYGEKELLSLYASGKAFYDYSAVRARWHGQFQNIYTVDETEYRKKKSDSLMHEMNTDRPRDVRRDMIMKLHEDGLSEKKIAERLKESGIPLSKSRVHDIIAEEENG
jgi:hypothetical protein